MRCPSGEYMMITVNQSCRSKCSFAELSNNKNNDVRVCACRYVEDIADFLLFCMQYGTVDWIEYEMDNSIVTWLLTTVCAPQCIKNPYVLAKLVEVLFVTPQNQNLHNMVMFHPIAQSVLVSSLMKFYVDIETTGNVRTAYFDAYT